MNRERKGHWNRWGPYVSERAWGTVREDYSPDGNAWNHFPHDHARFRAYRWNEDGLAGICDRHQYLCFALALWNGRDPLLKERLFGLNGWEGNHGEDVKEYYFYLDSTPTHSYMRYLYKYPQAEFPYARLVKENRKPNREEEEYELVNTGIFDENRYFDIGVECAKIAAEDILIRISVSNRGPNPAPIHVLPTLWFRNTWAWGYDDRRPSIAKVDVSNHDIAVCIAKHWKLGDYTWYSSEANELLFTKNETNCERLYGTRSAAPFVKDAFSSYVVDGRIDAVNSAGCGTKPAARYYCEVAPGETAVLQLRLAASNGKPLSNPFSGFDSSFELRIHEADEFYNVVIPSTLSEDEKRVVRQAFAGMLWSKQFYHYVVSDWLRGDPAQPAPPHQRRGRRNKQWSHVYNRDVVSMPDKWEFPWFASWDLGFHCVV